MLWITEKTDKPFEFIMHPVDNGELFVRFKVDDVFDGKEIDVRSSDMSKDNVIFIRETYATLPSDISAAVGKAYLYDENNVCLDSKIVNATPIEWKCNNPKLRLEIDL